MGGGGGKVVVMMMSFGGPPCATVLAVVCAVRLCGCPVLVVGRFSANGSNADLVPSWRPGRSPSRRVRYLNVNRFGAEVPNLNAKLALTLAT
uniref:Uncharacterized protein n=1 Tax=Oryza sativa subsp. japonica TaxID=39947 RepID=Q69SV7_ORYSJ|nr:hypothetical protein [Oryza sativa Japonica Group]